MGETRALTAASFQTPSRTKMLRDDREAQRFRIQTLERELEDTRRELESARAANRPAARARAWHRTAKLTIVVLAITVIGAAVLQQRAMWSRALDAEVVARTNAEADRDRLREDVAHVTAELSAERIARQADHVTRRAPMPAAEFGTILSPGEWQQHQATVTSVLGDSPELRVDQRCALHTLRGAQCGVRMFCTGRQIFPPPVDPPDVHCGPEPAGPRLEADDHSLVVDLDGRSARLRRDGAAVEWTF